MPSFLFVVCLPSILFYFSSLTTPTDGKIMADDKRPMNKESGIKNRTVTRQWIVISL